MLSDLEAFFGTIREIADRNAGRVFKTVGDEACMVFDRPESATNCAKALLEADLGLPIRAGLATGEATERDGDYFGLGLSLVARLLSLSEPGRLVFPDQGGISLPSRGLGYVRLKGFSEPVAVREWERPGFEPLELPGVGPINVPYSLSSYLGQTQFLAKLVDAIQTNRILTIVGFGGLGKTSASLAVARRLASSFLGGVAFCSLASFSSDASPESIRAEVMQSHDLLLSGQRRLLILDNCETIHRQVTGVVRDLLSKDGNLHILATSRTPLSITGQVALPIAPLPQEVAEQLFRERVTEVTGSEPRDHDLVSSICARLDGIPLAIELAAARAASMSLAQLRNRLEGSLAVLENRGALESRHQTMEATIAWSYNLLPTPIQEQLCKLSLFANGWSYEGAHFLLESELEQDTDRVLDELIRASLVQFRDDRYRLFEPVRDYCRAKLANIPDIAVLTRDRHVTYIQSLASESSQGLLGPDQAKWIKVLSEEQANIRVAMEWMVDPLARAELAVQLTGFWQATGRSAEGLPWIEAAMERLGDKMPPHAVSAAAVLAWRLGRLGDAEQWLRRALSNSRTSGDTSLALKLTTNLAIVTAESGRLEDAAALFQDALDLAQAPEHEKIRANVHNNLGNTLIALRRETEAEHHMRQGFELYQRQGNAAGMIAAQSLLGGILTTRGEVEAGCEEYCGSARKALEAGLTTVALAPLFCLIHWNFPHAIELAGHMKQLMAYTGEQYAFDGPEAKEYYERLAEQSEATSTSLEDCLDKIRALMPKSR